MLVEIFHGFLYSIFFIFLVLVALFFIPGAKADSWATPTFPAWKKIVIAEILEKSPIAYDESTPGSVQKKPARVITPVRYCNERQQDGSYLPVPCKDAKQND